MTHVNIPNDADHKVFVFIRDRLAETAAFVNSADDENGEIQFAAKHDVVKLTAKLRQYWPPHDAPQGNLVGSIDVYMSTSDGEAKATTDAEELPNLHPDLEAAIRTAMHGPLHDGTFEWSKPAASARPTTHEDLLAVYTTRAAEHGCGFLLAGELDEAAHILINGEPALDKGAFKLLTDSSGSYTKLRWRGCTMPRFGCGVFYYVADDLLWSAEAAPKTLREAIEAAFIELLDGAVPS